MTMLLLVAHSMLKSQMLQTVQPHYSMMLATPCMISLYQLIFIQIGQGLYLSRLSPILLMQQSFLLVLLHAIKRNPLHLEPFLLGLFIVFKMNLIQLSFLLAHPSTIIKLDN